MMLRIGRMAVTVPVLSQGDRHARGPPPPDPPREMPDPRDGEKRSFRRGGRPPAGARPGDGLARKKPGSILPGKLRTRERIANERK